MRLKSTFHRLATGTSLKPAAFLVLAALLFCLPGQGGTATNTIEFSKSLPVPGSIQWKVNHQLNQERQESFRKRVAIPDAVSPFVPRAASASLINEPRAAPSVKAPGATVFGTAVDLVFFATALVLVFALVSRRFAAQLFAELNQRFNPWAEPLTGARDMSAAVRSEEKPFGEFVAALQAGPVSAQGATPEADRSHGEFCAGVKNRLATLRELLQEVRRETSDAERKKSLVGLYFELGLLKDQAAVPEALAVWQAASALEGLLKELSRRIRSATPSTLRTIEGGLDLLDRLCVPEANPGLLTAHPFKFLVVDDDLISRQAISLSLKKAFSEADLAGDAPAALAWTSVQAYDVIFLDVQMPGMDGYELCQKIHTSALNRATPVVFVTSHSDFDARAKSTLVGGNDLMGKPFLIFELTVKALTLALQGRLLAGGAKVAPQLSAPPAAPAPASPWLAGGPSAARPVAPAAYAELNEATRAFVHRAIEHLAPLRELCESLPQTTDAGTRQNLLADLFLRLNSFSRNEPDVLHPACQLTSTLEGLIRKLLQDARHSTASTLATIGTAVDLLEDLCAPGTKAGLDIDPPIRLLVVDDDLVARRALAGALQTVFEKPEAVESGEAALALAQDDRFDVIFLDLQMPGMDGFETCSKIHATGCNQDTPIVFVTAHTDFAARAEISRTGGKDLVSKPFLTAEMSLKALTFALRGRLQQGKTQAGRAGDEG